VWMRVEAWTVIEKQPPGLWFLFCDSCGERTELDTDPDDSIIIVAREVKELNYRFNYAKSGWTHTCPDCVQDEQQKAMREAGL
jgi:hypothetical protein